MPAAQANGIFKNFEESLVSNVIKSIEEPLSKKQKKAADSNSGNFAATMIVVYFVEFVNGLKLNQHQLRTFEESAMSVYMNFVKPSVSGWTKSNIESTILPAMQIHSALTSVFFEVYFSKIDSKDREWLAKSYMQVFQDNVKSDTLGSRIVVATSVGLLFGKKLFRILTFFVSITG